MHTSVLHSFVRIMQDIVSVHTYPLYICINIYIYTCIHIRINMECRITQYLHIRIVHICYGFIFTIDINVLRCACMSWYSHLHNTYKEMSHLYIRSVDNLTLVTGQPVGELLVTVPPTEHVWLNVIGITECSTYIWTRYSLYLYIWIEECRIRMYESHSFVRIMRDVASVYMYHRNVAFMYTYHRNVAFVCTCGQTVAYIGVYRHHTSRIICLICVWQCIDKLSRRSQDSQSGNCLSRPRPPSPIATFTCPPYLYIIYIYTDGYIYRCIRVTGRLLFSSLPSFSYRNLHLSTVRIHIYTHEWMYTYIDVYVYNGKYLSHPHPPSPIATFTCPPYGYIIYIHTDVYIYRCIRV